MQQLEYFLPEFLKPHSVLNYILLLDSKNCQIYNDNKLIIGNILKQERER